jgi:Protein of unknown function (DUF2817)
MTSSFHRYLGFARSFSEGREWFCAAATANGGILQSTENPHGLTPDGARLSSETAWFGAANASRLFVSISGTHGCEYFAGLAGQLNWMVSGGPERLPADVAVCLLHAYNPYGAAWNSRGNENYVDLNRNYMDHSLPLRPNPLYAELFDLLFTADLDDHILNDVMDRFYAFVARNDLAEAMTAMGGGQRSHPTGTLYCGEQEEWSTQQLRKLVRDKLRQAEVIALIDWHTGIGAFGKPSVMNRHYAGPQEAAWAQKWWAVNGNPEDEIGPEFVGQVATSAANELRAHNARVIETVIEIGTFANRGVLMGLLIDRWLRFACKNRTAPDAVRLESRMIELLNPSNPEWRDAIAPAMQGIYEQTIAGLAEWQ